MTKGGKLGKKNGRTGRNVDKQKGQRMRTRELAKGQVERRKGTWWKVDRVVGGGPARLGTMGGQIHKRTHMMPNPLSLGFKSGSGS